MECSQYKTISRRRNPLWSGSGSKLLLIDIYNQHNHQYYKQSLILLQVYDKKNQSIHSLILRARKSVISNRFQQGEHFQLKKFIQNSKNQMQCCQICNVNERTNLLTKCCQNFICVTCKEKYERSTVCHCQKPILKKWCEPEEKLFKVISDYKNNKQSECSRCDSTEVLKYCTDCQCKFCEVCTIQVHAIGSYKLHNLIEINNVRKIVQNKKGITKQQICMDHRQKKQYICQCNYTPICYNCLKSHKESCIRKYRTLSQYKNEYFGLMLNKLDYITECKQHLISTNTQYQLHYKKQKEIYITTSQSVKQSFEKLEKLVEYKKNESLRNLETYWADCTQIYEKNIENIKLFNREYDDYARLIQKFCENMVGLDWLDKHINKKIIQLENFQFRLTSFDNIEKEIMAMNITVKKWETTFQNSEIIGFRGRKNSVANIQNPTPQLLSQINQNPLLPRPLVLQASSSEIQYQFLHLPYQKNQYEIQFGVGFKTKGQEVFKKIKANENGKGIIKGLNSGTTYRVRMRVINGGNWGPVSEITTLQTNSFTTANCPFAKSESRGSIMFLRGGSLYAVNAIEFGIHTWEIRTVVDKNSHSQSETACISIGISNREAKKALFVGTTINYGYQRQNYKIRVTLDCENNKMTITNDKQHEQIYQTLPQMPVFPTIINKGNSTVQLFITF